MSYTVTIEYTGIDSQVDKVCGQISRMYCPRNSYIDTPVYTQGYPVDAESDDDREYTKSVYATNVEGWGSTEVPEPYATTSIPFSSPLAQFKLAVVREDNVVTFEVDDYKEAFYYQTVGAQLADQGFTVTVESSSSSSDSESDSDSSDDDSSDDGSSDDEEG